MKKMPKRVLSGRVVKKSGEKTISVLVTRQTTHPIYKKIIRVSKKYLAHDEQNKLSVGDHVKITESKPFSKKKSWEVVV
jgi:small subunit ribosomal protein S17